MNVANSKGSKEVPNDVVERYFSLLGKNYHSIWATPASAERLFK